MTEGDLIVGIVIGLPVLIVLVLAFSDKFEK